MRKMRWIRLVLAAFGAFFALGLCGCFGEGGLGDLGGLGGLGGDKNDKYAPTEIENLDYDFNYEYIEWSSVRGPGIEYHVAVNGVEIEDPDTHFRYQPGCAG
ncbi:MAG: hypothetical protein IJB97_04320 [Clostridia bacterium]|nr:hypothetical protein [Clostridia bacterium]